MVGKHNTYHLYIDTVTGAGDVLQGPQEIILCGS